MNSELFFPSNFKARPELPLHLREDQTSAAADQMNLLYKRICARNSEADGSKKLILINLAIQMQTRQEAIDVLETFYNCEPDNDGVWIDEDKLFGYLADTLCDQYINDY